MTLLGTSTPSYTSTSPYYLDTDYPNYVAGDSNLQLTNARGVTFQIWVNLDSYTAGGGGSASYNSFIDAYYGSGTGDQINLRHSDTDDAIHFNVNGTDIRSFTLPSVGTWTLLTGTFDGSNAKLYYNDTLMASASSSGTVTINRVINIARAADNTEYVNGKIGAVRIFDRGLTQEEITSYYRSTYVRFGTENPTYPAVTQTATVTRTASQGYYPGENTWADINTFLIPGGGDDYYDNVLLNLDMHGSNGSTTFTDSSTANYTVTNVNSTAVSNTQYVFENSSAKFVAS